ncbi:NAD(P)H-dependent flavin oxidoreductase [Nocardia sp. NPDC088792]|uniref:NAD(P)H-dependent flavin oxidoreductase n=1 Tax=Nocardia sp. NPDC088792 TaxID=3364332 RepID=UPI00382FF88B
MALPAELADRLTLPLIAAPMTGVSGPELVTAACRNGVIGSFPTHNAPTVDALDTWLRRITGELAPHPDAAPIAPNLVVHRTNPRLAGDLDRLIAHGVQLVITSVGSPEAVIGPLHRAGCRVFADVATLRHAERALDAGADGLVLLTAGAGGQTGSANPFAFVRAIREHFSGPLVLAGGISDGRALFAARALGADLAYMGTGFIATTESLAPQDYREAVVTATLDDIRQTAQLAGLPANLLAAWLESQAPQSVSAGDFQAERLLDGRTVWSAGHSVSGVHAVRSVAELIERVRAQYRDAHRHLFDMTCH